MNPQYPPQQPPQHMQQHAAQQQPNADDVLIGELLRLIFHVVAEHHMPSDLVDKFSSMQNPHELIAELRQFNDANEHRIRTRDRGPKAPAPQEPRPRMPNGKVDRDLEATRAVRQMFQSALSGGKGK